MKNTYNSRFYPKNNSNGGRKIIHCRVVTQNQAEDDDSHSSSTIQLECDCQTDDISQINRRKMEEALKKKNT